MLISMCGFSNLRPVAIRRIWAGTMTMTGCINASMCGTEQPLLTWWRQGNVYSFVLACGGNIKCSGNWILNCGGCVHALRAAPVGQINLNEVISQLDSSLTGRRKAAKDKRPCSSHSCWLQVPWYGDTLYVPVELPGSNGFSDLTALAGCIWKLNYGSDIGADIPLIGRTTWDRADGLVLHTGL